MPALPLLQVSERLGELLHVRALIFEERGSSFHPLLQLAALLIGLFLRRPQEARRSRLEIGRFPLAQRRRRGLRLQFLRTSVYLGLRGLGGLPLLRDSADFEYDAVLRLRELLLGPHEIRSL